MSTAVISPTHPSPSETGNPPQQPARRKINKKGGYTRQKRGCLTCRRRKKKCDQGLPVCGHCSRLNLVCAHEEPQLHRAFRSGSALKGRNEWDGIGGVGASSPVSACSPSSDDHSRHQLSEISRLARVCETLDLVRPLLVGSGGNGDGDGGAGHEDMVASRRSMMRYYTTTLAVMLSATGENNYFLSVMLPMAFECPTLLDALAAWSSAHLALRYPDRCFRDASLRHRGRILAGLGAALQRNSLSSEMCLAVAMAMCSMETISEATTSGWADHLAGAAAALRQSSSSSSSSGKNCFSTPDSNTSLMNDDAWLRSFEGKWLLRNFAYHDILMSVSLDRRPFRTGDYWMSTDDSVADPYFGFASRILFLTSEISVLNADCAEGIITATSPNRENEDSDNDCFTYPDPRSEAAESIATDEKGGSRLLQHENASLLLRARSLARDLQEWTCPAVKPEEAPLAHLSETYRGAALIYLDRVLRKYFPSDSYNNVAEDILPEGVGVYVASICENAEKVPEGSLAECSLLFPLFLAGGAAEEEGHIASIRNRLRVMNTWRRFRNVDACREVLEVVWRHRLGGDSHNGPGKRRVVDWRDVINQRGWQLALS